MNRAKATITHIESVDSLNIVNFRVSDQQMQMVSLELSDTIFVGLDVIVGCKFTHVAIATDRSQQTTIPNQLYIVIQEIKRGRVLSSIIFDFEDNIWESLVTNETFDRLNLIEGDSAVATINASELSILQIDRKIS